MRRQQRKSRRLRIGTRFIISSLVVLQATKQTDKITRKLSSIEDRGRTYRVSNWDPNHNPNLDLWPSPSIISQLLPWPIHMQKIKVRGHSVLKLEWKQTDRRTDRRIEAIASPPVLTLSVISYTRSQTVRRPHEILKAVSHCARLCTVMYAYLRNQVRWANWQWYNLQETYLSSGRR